MMVYGRNREKYSLAHKPVTAEYDSDNYEVQGRESYRAKIYHRELRTKEKENEVLEALGGGSWALPEVPCDVLYQGGRFAGFLYESYDSFEMPALADAAETYVESGYSGRNVFSGSENIEKLQVTGIQAGIFLVSAFVEGFVFVPVFDNLVSRGNEILSVLSMLNAEGIVALIAGVILQVLFFLKSGKNSGNLAVMAGGGLLANLAGSALWMGVLILLSLLLTGVIGLVRAILPTVILIAILIYALKHFFKK